MRTGWWLPLCLLVFGSTGYIAASRLMFAAPLAAPVSMPGPASEGATDSDDGGFSPIDLVLGQGRITGQALLKDIGRSALQRLYTAIEQREDKRVP